MRSFDLRAAIEGQSWDWLFDLSPRLKVAIEIVDERFVPMLPARPGQSASAVHHLLATESSPLRSVISELSESSPRAVVVDGELCVCFALRPAGVLVLTRNAKEEGPPASASRGELEVIGSWLKGAIEANFAPARSDAAAEPHLIASLQRMLNESVARGSPRGVVSAFVETLAVWLDIEVRGYESDSRGQFSLSIVPVGADPAATASELDAAAVPAQNRVVRLSPSDAEHLGFASVAGDVLLRRLSTRGGSWLLVFAGTLGDDGEPRLTVYSDLLRESLQRVTPLMKDSVAADEIHPSPFPPSEIGTPDERERRARPRPFQAWIERLVSQAVQQGGHASVIVISIPDVESRPGFLQTQVGKIRNELRASDFVGSITAGEIAVLLRDTPPDRAAVISERLKKLLQWDVSAGKAILPSVGMVSCSADSPFEGSVVAAARENCAASSWPG